MGFLPELDRAYITVDNRLYFWNYKHGSDFTSFEDLGQTIVSLCLVKPKPDTFVETITHLLVLATPSELYILAVSYDPKISDLQLFDTGMTVSVKGLDITEIVASNKTGRIFFTANNDGINVWELQYSNVETWFKSKATKVCHTNQNIMGSLVPSISIPYLTDENSLVRGVINSVVGGAAKSKEGVIYMAIDDSRNLLYTLDRTSCIRTYHMAKDGSLKFSCRVTLKDLISGMLMAFSGRPVAERPTRDDFKGLELVSLHTVGTTESSTINLIAISTRGHRLYLRGSGSAFSFGGDNPPPTMLQVSSVKFPPSFDTSSLQVTQAKTLYETLSVSKIFEPGHFFCVATDKDSSDANIDRLFVAAPDSGQVIHQLSSNYNSQPRAYEIGSFVDIQGSVQAIELITKPFSANNKPEGFANECAAQYTVDPIKVAVLTNTGVYVYTRRFPYEVFQGLVPDANDFITLYGRTETCATALSVSAMSSLAFDIRDEAAKIYMEVGRKPQVVDDDSNTVSSIGEPAAVRLSGRFDGLATYLTRIVRLIWKQPIFKTVKVANDSDASKSRLEFKFNVQKSVLELVQLRLIEVEQFLIRYGSLIDGLSIMSDSLSYMSSLPKYEEIALQGEHRALNSLENLIKSMKQGIAFVQLLVEETATESTNVESILSYLGEDVRKQIASMDFKTFFTTKNGIDLSKEIVTGLVNKNINKNVSIDSIARSLQEKCERYVTGSDVLIYKALESLRKAKILAQTDPEGKARAIYESVRLFQSASKNFSFESLQEAVNELVELRGYSGAIEVALSVAANVDRGNGALGFLEAGKQPGDTREELYQKRLRIYQLIFDVLDKVDQYVEFQENKETGNLEQSNMSIQVHGPRRLENASKLRDSAYNICFNSDDELFHYSFYDWYFSKGLADRLLNMNTKFVRPYLITNAKTNFDVADLLWIYYQKHEDYYNAADVLFGLARSDYDLSLEERIQFLSRARGYCESDCPPGVRQAMTQLGNTIQEYLEIANVQLDILHVVQADERFNDVKRESAIKMLDGKLMNASDLFNKFADPLNYYEICLSIFQVTDYRGTEEITDCWQKLIFKTFENADTTDEQAFERISTVVQRVGRQLSLSELVFPIEILVPFLEVFDLERIKDSPRGWIVDTFINAGVAFESLYAILNGMMLRKEFPFNEHDNFVRLAIDVVFLLERWATSRQLQGQKLSEIIPIAELNNLRTIVGQKNFNSLARRI